MDDRTLSTHPPIPTARTTWIPLEGSRPAREEESLNAYVLIQTKAGLEPVAEQVRGIPGVIAAEDTTGPFDAIALARSASSRSLTDQVVAQIQQLPGVIRAISAPLIGSLGLAPALALGGRVEAA